MGVVMNGINTVTQSKHTLCSQG